MVNVYLSAEINFSPIFFLSIQATARILEAHANVKDLSLMESKMKFIQAWQSLPEYGVTLFVIKFDGHKKEELLGVAHNRIMRMDVNNGDHLKIWRYNTMKVSLVNIHYFGIFLWGKLFIFFLSIFC